MLPARWMALLLGAVAFVCAIAITGGNGPGLDPDALAYVGAATSLAHHGSLRVPSSGWDAPDSTSALTTWPPGFSVAMAIPQSAGVSPLASARLVVATAAFVSAAVLSLLLESAAGWVAGLVGVMAFLVTPAVVGVHLSVLSEPLFLACLALTLAGMVGRSSRPFLAGIPAAVAVMVRYAGICAPAAVILWFFFRGRKPLRNRFADGAEAALPSVILIGAWITRNMRLSDGESGAELAFYGKLGPTLREGMRTISDWLVPGVESAAARGLLAAALMVLLAFVAVKAVSRIMKRSGDDDVRGALCFLQADLLLLFCYLGVLVSARLFVGDAIPFDFRLFSPAIMLAEGAIVVVLASSLTGATRAAKLAAGFAIALWFAGSMRVSADMASESVNIGSDFAANEWRSSPTLQWVRSQSAGWALFTNWPAAVYFRTSRIARDIPQTLGTAELREFGEILREQHGAFVAFNLYNTDYPPSESIAHSLGLVEARRFNDGAVWVTSAVK